MATLEERAALDRQIRELRNRLNERKIQKARYGISADPSITNEIEDLEFTIATMERQRDGPRLLDEAREGIERHLADNIAFLLTTVREIAERQSKLEVRQETTEARVKDVAEQQNRDSHWRLNVTSMIEEVGNIAQRNEVKRRWGQWRNTALLAAALAILIWLLLVRVL